MNLKIVATLKETLGHMQAGDTITIANLVLSPLTLIVANIVVGNGIQAEGKVTLLATTGGLQFSAEVTDNEAFLPEAVKLPSVVEPMSGFLADLITEVVGDGVVADVVLSAEIVADATAAPAIAKAVATGAATEPAVPVSESPTEPKSEAPPAEAE